MASGVPRLYVLVALGCGYLLLMFANPVRRALRDGLRCITRFERIWLTFLLLGLAYSAFQFLTFTPLHNAADLGVGQAFAVTQWNWPNLSQVWRDTPLPALEGLAGIFDNAT